MLDKEIRERSIYISVDGDDVGSQLEYYIITSKLDELQSFSKNYKLAMLSFKKALIDELRANIIFDGGDSLFAVTCFADFDKALLERIRTDAFAIAKCTMSIGLGRSSQEAYIALKLAKTGGKNQIIDLMEI